MSDSAPESVRHAERLGVPEAADAMVMASRLWLAGSLLTDYVTAKINSSELQLGEAEVLMATRVRGGRLTTPADLREQLNLTSPGITKRIDHVERRGLLERRPHPTDRRSVTLHLTPEGETLADDAIRLVAGAMAELSDPAPASTVASLNSGLAELIDTLRTRA